MIHDLLVIAAPALVLVGTVLRMWDALAEADKEGEFAPGSSAGPRTSREELHRIFIFFTPLERFAHAATKDREQYYLRTAQGWFFLSLGASVALLLAIASVLGGD